MCEDFIAHQSIPWAGLLATAAKGHRVDYADSLAFLNKLRHTIENLYEKYQRVQHHLSAPFFLTDHARLRLLRVFYFRAPEEDRLGALGYEWQRLTLRVLKTEEKALHAKATLIKALTPADQHRLQEIKNTLAHQQRVMKYYTSTRPKALELSIPECMKTKPMLILCYR